MNHLSRALGAIFKPAPAPRADTGRRHREWAKPVAKEYGIEIERLDAGFNVWPPKGVDDSRDPYAGDHHAQDWEQVAVMVKEYAFLMGGVA